MNSYLDEGKLSTRHAKASNLMDYQYQVEGSDGTPGGSWNRMKKKY